MGNEYILELTLISAQELEKTTTFHRMKPYALLWIDPSNKLRSCVDRVGGRDPTWNDKFLFKVSSEFLYGETSGISIEIFDNGVIRDTLVGTVRLLVGNVLRPGLSYVAIRKPFLNAVQVRRPSGRFQGVLNIGASVLLCSDVPAMTGISAISFRDLIKEAPKSKTVTRSYTTIGISYENSFPDYQCDGRDPKHSSPTARASKELCRVKKEMKITKHARSSSEGDILVMKQGLSPKKAAGRHRSLPFNDQKPTWHVRSRLAFVRLID